MNSTLTTPASLDDPAPTAWVRSWGAAPQAPDSSVSFLEPPLSARPRGHRHLPRHLPHARPAHTFSFAPRNEETAAFLAMFPGEPVNVDDIIAAHLQAAARACAHGAKVYAATVAPYGGSDMYTHQGDKAREQINDWIRTSGAFDAVLDFDAVWRDPADPRRIHDDLHMGDRLHGNDTGYAALAESIDLSLFD
ncbi:MULTISPECIES: GDSL-type esterase/lipase family protein [Streptomyces]|uniref:GDSL-type esterase/lipase family protein n=1 Tax=Streptomyces ramulosus TaxID=47762 RepID=A0ABW1FSY1_9ACTN